MSKAAELAALIGSQTAQSNRNLIINGAMNVAQRGTSATGLGDSTVGYNTLDKYRLQKAGSPTARYTMTQDSNAPDGFANSLKVEVTTADTSPAANDHQYIDQFIEAQNLQQLAWDTSSNGKRVTLSFYVKCSIAQTFAVDFINEDNSRYYNTTYTVSSADTWERKTINLPADASNGFNDDNGRGLRVRWTLLAGSDYTGGSVSTSWSGTLGRAANHENTWVGATGRTWQLTGVQLEVGDVATPFEHRSFADELLRCQRYFQVVGNETYFAGNGVGSANIATGIPLGTPMRAAPSVPDTGYVFHRSGNTNSGTNSVTSVTYNNIGSSNLQLRVNFGSGISDEVAYVLKSQTADLQLSAEL